MLSSVKKIRKKQKDSKMNSNSIHLWYEAKNNKNDLIEMKLDINVIVFDHKKDYSGVYFDFGLRISHPYEIKEIYLYVPFEDAELIDLGGLLDERTIRGLFNEDYSVRTDEINQPKKKLVWENGKNVFSIYCLDVVTDNEDLQQSTRFSGTKFEIHVKDARENEEYYYRFRVKAKKVCPIIDIYRPKNRFFESAYSACETINFRVNESRNQHPSLLQNVREGQEFLITDLSFFLVVPIEDDIDEKTTHIRFSRLLEEHNFWKGYFKRKYNKMGVYNCHGKKETHPDLGKEYVKDFTCYTKIMYKCNDIITIIKYFIYTVILSVIMHYVSQLLDLLNWKIPLG